MYHAQHTRMYLNTHVNIHKITNKHLSLGKSFRSSSSLASWSPLTLFFPQPLFSLGKASKYLSPWLLLYFFDCEWVPWSGVMLCGIANRPALNPCLEFPQWCTATKNRKFNKPLPPFSCPSVRELDIASEMTWGKKFFCSHFWGTGPFSCSSEESPLGWARSNRREGCGREDCGEAPHPSVFQLQQHWG